MPEPSAWARRGADRVQLRLAAALLLDILAVIWLLIAIRLYFNPPSGVEPFAAALLAVPAAVNGFGYGLCSWWVSRRFPWGYVIAFALVGLNLVLGFTGGMTWIDWFALGCNLVALVLLVVSWPRRS